MFLVSFRVISIRVIEHNGCTASHREHAAEAGKDFSESPDGDTHRLNLTQRGWQDYFPWRAIQRCGLSPRGYNVTVAMTMLAVINFHESIFTERNRSTTSRKWFQLPPVTVSRQVMKYGHESFGKVSRNQLIATIRRVSDVASRLQLGPSELSTEEAGETKKERPGDWMPIRVTEIENGRSGATGLKGANNGDLNNVDSEREEIALKVEGTLYRKEAELLERICRDLASQTRKQITLELSNLSFLDSDSAAVLCLLKRELGVSLEGLHLFIGKVVELAEESEKVERYRPRTGISTDCAD